MLLYLQYYLSTILANFSYSLASEVRCLKNHQKGIDLQLCLGVVISAMRNGLVIRGKPMELDSKWDVMEKKIRMFFKVSTYLKVMSTISTNRSITQPL